MELIGKNITYKYPSSKKYVLKDVDITLNSDKITGLIGESGKGKQHCVKYYLIIFQNMMEKFIWIIRYFLKMDFARFN